MSTLCQVETVPALLREVEEVEFGRIPVVDELLYTEDQTFRVVQVFHPLTKGDKPIVRMVPT